MAVAVQVPERTTADGDGVAGGDDVAVAGAGGGDAADVVGGYDYGDGDAVAG